MASWNHESRRRFGLLLHESPQGGGAPLLHAAVAQSDVPPIGVDAPGPTHVAVRGKREKARRHQPVRAEAAVAGEQSAHFAAEADDARLRALVSETPIATADARTTQRHADSMRAVHEEMLRSILALEREQDAVLDQMSAARQ